MTAGRPPKPTALKLLEGNPGKRDLNAGEPKPPPGPISPPPWLRGRARTAWRWVAPVLEQMGVLRTADVHALALLCDAYAEYIDCAAVVRKLGRTYESRVFKASTRRVAEDGAKATKPGGSSDPDPTHAADTTEEEAAFDQGEWSVIIRPRPEVRMASEARRQVLRIMTEFGMTASSRLKLFVSPAEAPADPFEQWERGSRLSS